MLKELFEQLDHPSSEYRGAPFWSWNGQKAGVAAWAPWEVDITEFLKTGENQLELKLYSHRRNSHGPLYQNDPHPKGTSPNSFMEYNDRYALVSCGLRSAPQIAVRSVTG